VNRVQKPGGAPPPWRAPAVRRGSGFLCDRPLRNRGKKLAGRTLLRRSLPRTRLPRGVAASSHGALMCVCASLPRDRQREFQAAAGSLCQHCRPPSGAPDIRPGRSDQLSSLGFERCNAAAANREKEFRSIPSTDDGTPADHGRGCWGHSVRRVPGRCLVGVLTYCVQHPARRCRCAPAGAEGD
jgi:hypothetical protein